MYRGLATPNRKVDSSPLLFDNHSFVGCWKEQNNKSDMEKEEKKCSDCTTFNSSEIMENQTNILDELRALKYEIKKKKTWVAFLLTLFLGPFGLFYTGKWVAALIMVLLELYQIFNYTNNALSLNLVSFSHNIMYIVAMYFISLVLAPILTASYNSDLSKEMDVK